MGFLGAPRGRNLLVRLLWCSSLWCFALPATAAEPTKNPHYQTALRLYDAFEYEEALRVLEKAAQWPSNTLDDRVSIALLEGVLAFETQQPDRAKGAFHRALSMNPGAKLQLPVSPKVAAVLEEARIERRPLDLTLPPTGIAAQPESAPIQVEARSRPNLKLPVAIGGGVIAVGGLVSLGRAMSLASKVSNADQSIGSRAQLEDTLQQSRTFEKVGWALMGVGVVTTAGSLLFLDSPAKGARASITPVSQGAHVSLNWSLP